MVFFGSQYSKLDCRVCIVCLQETKKASISHFMLLSLLGNDFDDSLVLPAAGSCGGILLAWKSSVCRVAQTRIDDFSVIAQFQQEGRSAWWFTGVYGPHSDDLKLQFFQELQMVCSACNGPWMIGGDFNLIYQADDKNNDNLNRAMMGRFRRLLNDLQLKELPLLRRKYTWSNERANPTLVRLDWVFCTADWDDGFPDCVLQSSASLISDHCPLLMGLHELTQGKRRFHFESFWTRLEGFMEVVELSWSQPVEANCPLQIFATKLQRLSRQLQAWSHKKVGNIKQQLLMAKEILHRLEIERDSRSLSPSEEWLRRKLNIIVWLWHPWREL
jgi:exonuclease III